MKYFRASPRMSPGSRARAKAKSIALEIEKLSDQCMVMLDFDGINEIGQEVSDQLFSGELQRAPWNQVGYGYLHCCSSRNDR